MMPIVPRCAFILLVSFSFHSLSWCFVHSRLWICFFYIGVAWSFKLPGGASFVAPFFFISSCFACAHVPSFFAMFAPTKYIFQYTLTRDAALLFLCQACRLILPAVWIKEAECREGQEAWSLSSRSLLQRQYKHIHNIPTSFTVNEGSVAVSVATLFYSQTCYV